MAQDYDIRLDHPEQFYQARKKKMYLEISIFVVTLMAIAALIAEL